MADVDEIVARELAAEEERRAQEGFFGRVARRGKEKLTALGRQIGADIVEGGRDLNNVAGMLLPPVAVANALRKQLTQPEPSTEPELTQGPWYGDSSDPGVRLLAMAAGAGAPGGKAKAAKNALSAALREAPEGAALGLHPETTAGRIINRTNKRGGYSVNLPSGAIPTEGLMMGRYRNEDPRNLVADRLTRAHLAQMVQKNRDVLGREDAYLGTWRDPEGGKTYVDVSRRFKPNELRQATKYGERTGQLAGYDVGKGKPFPVGNWEKFVSSPEFGQRLDEMAGVGRDYLSRHPTKEWWDMHGGAFERVYGRENLPQVAGFVASTAPVESPTRNLQKASEYLRRHIKGEPTLQPEWRAPAGQMTWREGSQIGLENSFAKNLEHARAGRLDQLQADKVREEAQALMGDPNAVVLDRHWSRLAEDPSRGIFTSGREGVIEPGKQYQTLKAQIVAAAQAAGRNPRDFSADVWTGIRETIKNRGELYGRKFRAGAIQGESKSYADLFEDLIARKAQHEGITVGEMEKRLRSGDATLLAWLAATPLLAPVFADVLGGQSEGSI